MNNQSESHPKDNMSLLAIGSSKEYLMAFAKYFPDEKDAIIKLILADATILPRLGDRGIKSGFFEICLAFPNYATEIAIQLLHNHATQVRQHLDNFGFSETTFIVFCLLNMSIDSDQFHYQDFIKIFPDESKLIFAKLCENDEFFRVFMCHSSRFRITFAQLPENQDRLVAALLRQPDNYWLQYFEQLAMLFLVIKSCEPRHHQLFDRYFEIAGLYQEQVALNGVELFVAKLINLILVDSFIGYNEFGVDMLKAIVRYYPVHQETIFQTLHDNPSVLSRFISSGHFIFREMLKEFPERIPLILDALSKMPALPGLIGLFTHGIIDAKVTIDDIAILKNYSLDKARVVIETLFSNQVSLKATLSVHRCYEYFNLAALAPNQKAQVIEIFAQTHADALVLLSNSLYEGIFPEEMWLWLNMARLPGFILNESQLGGLIARDFYLQNICQLFPEYKDVLIRFFARNKKFACTVFGNVDMLFYATRQAPQLHGELIVLFCEFCSLTVSDIQNAEEGERESLVTTLQSYRKVNYSDALAVFPDHGNEILGMIFGNTLGFNRFQRGTITTAYEFAHQYPEHQCLLINALITYPNSFNDMLKDPEMLHAFFLLMPNRNTLAMALSKSSNICYKDFDKLSSAVVSVSGLQSFLPEFLETLFARREVLECVFGEYVLPKWLKLPQYQTQFLRHYCQYPEYLDRINGGFYNDLTEENSRLLFMAEMVSHKDRSQDYDSLDNIMAEDLIFYQGINNKASIRVLIKLIDRMIKTYDEESVARSRLLTLRERMLPLAFPTLQMFCVEMIRGDEDAMKVASSISLLK